MSIVTCCMKSVRRNRSSHWKIAAYRCVVPTLTLQSQITPSPQSGGRGYPLTRLPVVSLSAWSRTWRDTEIPYIPVEDLRQGIVHVIGPEQGFTLPGITLVCGDSHTSTHGAFGALAFGIGASECGIVLATQCLKQSRSRTMRVRLVGIRQRFVTAKDIALALVARIGANGASGYALEYSGSGVETMSMEERMTLCNMAIETGARVGLVAPDETTFAYLRGRPLAPTGALWDRAVAYWRDLKSDDSAQFDRELELDASEIAPFVTWGTSPEDALPVTGRVPDPNAETDPLRRDRRRKALRYMGLTAGQALQDISVDRVFIGSCTNSRIEDLRLAASVVVGRRVAANVRAIVVPGSGLVHRQAEHEGLAAIFLEAGFEWREAGCSMCVGMNGDLLKPGERCASTSNRNFEGRQGQNGRTHLISPSMAAAAAVTGRLADIRQLMDNSR